MNTWLGEHLVRPEVLDPIRQRNVEIALAVRPHQMRRLRWVLRRLEGIRVILWPMLADADGRWLNLTNVRTFMDFVDQLPTKEFPLLLDLEPPIHRARELLRGKFFNRRHARSPDARNAAVADAAMDAIAEMTTRAARTEAVVPAPLIWGEPWSSVLATPPLQPAFAAVEVMGYSSLLEGYGRGLIQRRQALDLTRRLATAASQLGWRLSVGVTGGGALGDERPLRSVGELAQDVAIAHQQGVTAVSLHSLQGALERPPLSQWLDALCTPWSEFVAPRSLRGAAIWHTGLQLTRAARRWRSRPTR